MSGPADEGLIVAFHTVADLAEYASKPEIYHQASKTLHQLRLLMEMMDCPIPNLGEES